MAVTIVTVIAVRAVFIFISLVFEIQYLKINFKNFMRYNSPVHVCYRYFKGSRMYMYISNYSSREIDYQDDHRGV